MTLIIPSEQKIVWQPHKGSQELALTCPAREILFHGSRGPGKSLILNEKVFTDSGIKQASDITYDDLLIAEDGSYTRILGIYPQKNRPMYRVHFYDGTYVTCDAEHRWKVLNNKTGYREGWKVRTVEQMLKVKTGYSIPFLQGAIPGKKWQGLDPYAIGYIIANGTTGSKNVTIFSIDNEILEYFTNLGWYRYKYDQTAERAVCPAKLDKEWRQYLPHCKGHEKYIPKELLEADAETRLALLQGLMDGDGNFESGAKSRYSTSSEQLANDVAYIVKSLGGWATAMIRKVKPEHNTFSDKDYRYVVNISHHNMFNPFRLKRKADRVLPQKKFLTRGIKSIEFIGHADAVCFAVEHESHCFLCGDFHVTHNTDAQLMRFRSRVGLGYGKFWRGVIFDMEYKNLDDLVAKSLRWFPEFDDGAEFKRAKSDYKWVWPTGEELMFRAVSKPEHYWSYHGMEFPFIGWNELTKYPNIILYDAMLSCNRSSFLPKDYAIWIDGEYYHETGQIKQVSKRSKNAIEHLLPQIPLEVFSTTNPFGVGHNWVKKYFIDQGAVGEIVKNVKNVFNPQTQQNEDVIMTKCHIFGSYRENRNLSPEYVARLSDITDINKRRAWLGGCWDITSGGMFDDLWRSDVHKIAPFDIPASWTIDRSFDWGSSKPFSVGWWAKSDGTEIVYPDGTRCSTVRGDLFRIYEWYGCEEGQDNVGLRLADEEIAQGIVERQIRWGIHNRVVPGPADNSIWDVSNKNSVAATMAKKVKVDGKVFNGVEWVRSDKSQGSRVRGWQRMRRYFQKALPNENGQPREEPGLFIFDRCKHTLALIPSLPRDEVNLDDVDTNAEDHIADEMRYRILQEMRGASSGTTQGGR